MELEKLEIRVNGKDYVCLKPYPITLMQIEANCSKDDGALNYDKWADEMLKLISKDLNKNDLVKYKPTKVVLENGTTIEASEITYKQYTDGYDKLKNGMKDLSGVMNTYLSYCGIVNYNLGTLTRQDILNIIDAYASMFDETELTKAIEAVSTFR